MFVRASAEEKEKKRNDGDLFRRQEEDLSGQDERRLRGSERRLMSVVLADERLSHYRETLRFPGRAQ